MASDLTVLRGPTRNSETQNVLPFDRLLTEVRNLRILTRVLRYRNVRHVVPRLRKLAPARQLLAGSRAGQTGMRARDSRRKTTDGGRSVPARRPTRLPMMRSPAGT